MKKNSLSSISIIIPLYNNGSTILKTLKSVLDQTINEYEIIIINDGSTDDSMEKVKTIKNDKIKIFSKINEGVSIARNFGVLKSKYDLIAFLDSDDEWHPNYLENIFSLYRIYPDAGLYFTKIELKYKNKTIPQKFKNLPNKDFNGLIDNIFKFYLIEDKIIYTSSVAMRKEVFNEFNGFSLSQQWGEDQDLWFRIASRYPIAYSSNICSIINRPNSDTKKNIAKNRILNTPQHPFIKNGEKIISMNYLTYNKKEDIKHLIIRLKIKSALLNLQIGKYRRGLKMLYTSAHNSKILFFKTLIIVIRNEVSRRISRL